MNACSRAGDSTDHKSSSGRDDGFTLLELMVVVLVLGILSAVAIPTYTTVRARADRAAATSVLKNVHSVAASLQSAEGHLPGFEVLSAQGGQPRIVSPLSSPTGPQEVSVHEDGRGAWRAVTRTRSGECLAGEVSPGTGQIEFGSSKGEFCAAAVTETLLGAARWVYTAGEAQPASPLPNSGHGSAAPVVFGSSPGADSSDPVVVIPDPAERYVYLGASNQTIIASKVGGSFTDLDVSVDAVVLGVNYGSDATLASRWATASFKSWNFMINTAGRLVLVSAHPGGTTTSTVQSTVTVPTGVRMEYRFTRTADGVTTFYTRTPGSSAWTQAGSPVVGYAGTLHAGTNCRSVGGNCQTSTMSPIRGRVYNAEFYTGNRDDNGTLDARFDADDLSPYTNTGVTGGMTWTVYMENNGRVPVIADRPVLLTGRHPYGHTGNGTNAYGTVPDHPDLNIPAGQAVTLFWVGQIAPRAEAGQAIIAKSTGVGSPGWSLDRGGPTGFQPRFTLSDGTTTVTATGPTVTARKWVAVFAVREQNGTTRVHVVDTQTGTVTSGTPTSAPPIAAGNTGPMHLMRFQAPGTGFFDGATTHTGMFPFAFTTDDMKTVTAALSPN